jgi:phosphomannomutase
MVARTGKSLRALLGDLFARVGPLYPLRRDVHLTAPQQARLKATLDSSPTQLAEMRVERVEKMDGLKLYLHGGGWLLVRASGTEPVVRLYAEAGRAEMTKTLLEEGQRMFLG